MPCQSIDRFNFDKKWQWNAKSDERTHPISYLEWSDEAIIIDNPSLQRGDNAALSLVRSSNLTSSHINLVRSSQRLHCKWIWTSQVKVLVLLSQQKWSDGRTNPPVGLRAKPRVGGSRCKGKSPKEEWVASGGWEAKMAPYLSSTSSWCSLNRLAILVCCWSIGCISHFVELGAKSWAGWSRFEGKSPKEERGCQRVWYGWNCWVVQTMMKVAFCVSLTKHILCLCISFSTIGWTISSMHCIKWVLEGWTEACGRLRRRGLAASSSPTPGSSLSLC